MKELPTKKPWDQRENETDTAYHRFSLYLELGPDRSIPQVAEKLRKGNGYATFLRRWSAEHDWVARVGDYDKHILQKSLRNKEEVLDRGKARLLKMMDKALDGLEEALELDHIYVENDDQDGENVKKSVVSPAVVAQKLKAIDSVLNRIGLVEQKEVPDTGKGSVTINNYVQNIYNKMRHRDNE